MDDPFSIIRQARTIAVVGSSPEPWRSSHQIASYLKHVGFHMIPVNPHYDLVLDEVCYPRLQDIPLDIEIDIVNIFRRSIYTIDVVEDAIERLNLTGRRPVLWAQPGVTSSAARSKAEAASLPYIEEACIKVVHKLSGTMAS